MGSLLALDGSKGGCFGDNRGYSAKTKVILVVVLEMLANENVIMVV